MSGDPISGSSTSGGSARGTSGSAGAPSGAGIDAVLEAIREPMIAIEMELDSLYRSDYPGVHELLRYISRYRGKRMRPAMVVLAGLACGDLIPAHRRLAVVLEVLHTATLLHDDVIDEADVRRQVVSVNRRFGNETAVLLGDFLFSESFCLAVAFEDREVGREVSVLCRDLCLGEMLEITRRFDLDLSEEEYFDIIRKKTAILFEVGCGIAARLSGASAQIEQALREFARSLGMAFQVVDDCLDIIGEQDSMGKSLGNDVAHGMTTLPLLHFLRTAPEDARLTLREVFREPASADREQRISRLLRGNGSIAYAYGVAEGWTKHAVTCLEQLRPSPYRDALGEVLQFVVRRIS